MIQGYYEDAADEADELADEEVVVEEAVVEEVIAGADLPEDASVLTEAETIQTEYSYKYTPNDIAQLAALAGYGCQRVWIDDARQFGVFYLSIA